MSQENVEIVRRAVQALNERDIESYIACCTADVVLRTPLIDVAGVYEGPKGIRRFFADVEDAGPDFRIDIERLEAVPGGRALAFMRVTSTGRVSGIPAELETANVYDFAGGKIRRIDIFAARSQALEAAGLRE